MGLFLNSCCILCAKVTFTLDSKYQDFCDTCGDKLELQQYFYGYSEEEFNNTFITSTNNMDLTTWIVVDNSEMFEGTREQFMDCFFSNATDEEIIDWCRKHQFKLIIGEDVIFE